MSESEFDVSLLDELKPLDDFLDESEHSLEIFESAETLLCPQAEDFIINEPWILQDRIKEITPTAEGNGLIDLFFV